jgi:alpha-amylase
VEVWTRFDFAGRAGAHAPRTLDARHFSAVDFDGRSPEAGNAIYVFEGKRFEAAVDEEFGNYHYLMGCDLDHSHPDVRAMNLDWGRWYLDTTGVDGLRLDAVKHIPTWVLPLYLDALREHAGRDLPVVAEYWSQHLAALEHFLTATGQRMMLFDVPLHYTFHLAGRVGSSFDLRTVFSGSLVAVRPEHAVTFVDNHDSQPMQALESTVADWFKPLAYALILLRRDGLPCVFAADYDGAEYTEQRWGSEPEHVMMPSFRPFLDTCLALRRELGDAAQDDHFDHPNVVGWVRRAVDVVVVVLMSNGADGRARIGTGLPGLVLTDATGADDEPITTDAAGGAEFRCPGRGVSLWVGRRPR